MSHPPPVNDNPDLELESYRPAAIESTLEGKRFKEINVVDPVAESEVLVHGSQRTGIGDVEGIEGELDLIPFPQLERVVGMQIELVVGSLGPDASPAAYGHFAGSVVHRVRTEFADRLPRAGAEAQAAGEAPHETVEIGRASCRERVLMPV